MTQAAKNSNNAQPSHWCFSISSNANFGVGSGRICYFSDQGLYSVCEYIQPKRSREATDPFLNGFPWSSSSASLLQAAITRVHGDAPGMGTGVRTPTQHGKETAVLYFHPGEMC